MPAPRERSRSRSRWRDRSPPLRRDGRDRSRERRGDDRDRSYKRERDYGRDRDRYDDRDGKYGRTKEDERRREKEDDRPRVKRERDDERRPRVKEESDDERDPRRPRERSPRPRDRSRDRDGDNRRLPIKPEPEWGAPRSHHSPTQVALRRRSRSPPPRAFPSPSHRPSHSPRPRSGSRSVPPVDEEKLKPNFAPSGALAAATNTLNGVVLKYNEPPEARKPADEEGWRLYVFEGDEDRGVMELRGRSGWLVGRDKLVCDILIEDPSCSKQHAVVQFRQLTKRNEYGDTFTVVKPFIIDLESTNGTFVNGEEIPKSRFYELMVKDVIKFGLSKREYVLLKEDAAA